MTVQPERPLAADAGVKAAPMGASSGLVETAVRMFLRRCCRLEASVDGPLPDGPFMVCTNHRSHVDSVAVMVGLGLPFSACGLIAAEDYFFSDRSKVSAVSRVLTLIPMSRRPSPSAFKSTLSLCDDFIAGGGRLLVSYPEGTRNMAAGLASFRRGPAALAMRLGLPIIPGFISGTERVMPKGRLIPRCAPVRVRFGSPIDVDAFAAGGNSKAASSALNSLIKERVSALAAPDGVDRASSQN